MGQSAQQYLATELDAVQRQLLAVVQCSDDQVNQLVAHAVSAGKRIRAMMVLLMSKLLGAEGETMVKLAVIIELIHAATLVHDDVIDHATERRDSYACHAHWGVHASILGGDYIYAQAFKEMVEIEDWAVLRRLSLATTQIVEGELKQSLMQHTVPDLSGYYEAIHAKTAILFETACCVAAIHTRADAAQLAAATQFGHAFGMLYQMMDDVRDYFASDQALGKKAGNDFTEGKGTLPLIIALQSQHPAAKLLHQAFMQQQAVSHQQLQQWMQACIDREQLLRPIQDQFDQAQQALNTLPDQPARTWLSDLLQQLLQKVNTSLLEL